MESVVRRFQHNAKKRGRKVGWRKTTQSEDKQILAAFARVRKPLGILVEKRDVWKALPLNLRNKISIRTVGNRLAQKGHKMREKLARDDKGEKWRRTRMVWCGRKRSRTATQWAETLQGCGDFRYFNFYPRGMKARHARKSAPRTIMSKKERRHANFTKPRKHIFKRSEYKRTQQVKVFGLTTSNGKLLICRAPKNPDANDWIRLVEKRVGPFMREAFPGRARMTILLASIHLKPRQR